MQLSKSEFMMFLKQPAWLWLKKHDKSKLPEVDEDTRAIFDAGFLFESLAEQLFPRAVRVEADHSGFKGYEELIPKTKLALESGAKTILQGRFLSGNITCICDVLVRVGDKSFDLYEIKSSTSVKPAHLPDLAFQVEVLKGSDLLIRKIYLAHVNSSYARRGEVVANDLVKVDEVTEQVKKLKDQTKENIEKAFKTIESRTRPNISPAQARLGSFYEWMEIYKAIAKPEPDSIYYLCSPSAGLIAKLEKMDINNIADIPGDIALSDKQKQQVEAVKTNQVLINKPNIKKFLSKLKYPLYFLDYETLASVVPYFDGLRPYQQLPFQYSLHILKSPDAKPEHFEYLHRDDSNPVATLSERLKKQIGENGTILVWYDAFEKGCNDLMGTMAPEYKDFYKALNRRVVDLMTPFINGYYVDKDFCGSASIKKVLPVLVPELSYKTLEIQKGGAAQRLWMEAVLDGKRAEEKEKILENLLKYCELDTLAMVRIFKFLTNLVEDNLKLF